MPNRGWVVRETLMLKRIFLIGLLALLVYPTGTAQAEVAVLSQAVTADKVIALTFDDGWDNKACEQVRQILAEHQIAATIFPVGSWAASNSDVLQRYLADGHELGNHSMTHPKLTMLSLAQQKQELREAQAVLTRIGGDRVTDFVRPPYGAYNKKTLQAAAQLGLRPVTWSIDSWDWRDIPVEQVVERTLSSARPGGVILMHLAGRNTVKALPLIISGLLDQGYTFSPLSALFAGQEVLIPNTGSKPVGIMLQGEVLPLQPSALLIEGTTFVPCREFLQHFGWLVRWNEQQQIAVCQSGAAQILVQPCVGTVLHGLTGRLENGKLYVPLRSLATELGLQVGWIAKTNTASLR